MLTLKVNNEKEYIKIGDNIKVYVKDAGSGIKVTIDAPREIKIIRSKFDTENKNDEK